MNVRGAARDIAAEGAALVEWWTGVLAAALPSWARRFMPPRAILLVDPRANTVTEYPGGRLLPNRGAEDGTGGLAGTVAARAKAEPRPHIALRLHEVIRTTAVYPYAARHDLRDLVALDIDRLSPFSRSDVLCSYDSLKADKTANTIHVSVCIARMADVADAVSKGQAFGAPLRYVGPADGPPWEHNLLDGKARRYRTVSAAPLLWIAAAGLVMANLAIPLVTTALEARRLTDDIVVLEETVRTRSAERQVTADAAVRQATFVDERTSLVPALAALTGVLADEARLTRLVFDAGKLDISGTTNETSTLVSTLLDHPLIARVTYAAPVSVEPEDGTETFRLMIDTRADQTGAAP